MPEPVHDLLIRGGHLIDPAAGLTGRYDVAFRDGRVTAVAPSIPAEQGRRVIDARGQVLAPGLVDLHTHVFWGVAHLGVEADPYCVARGVTTAIDAGCAGATTYPGFRRYVVDVSATRIYALLNISAQGMLDQKVGELEDIRFADVQRAIQTCEANRDVIVGVKVRMSPGVNGAHGLEPLRRAREAADAVGRPVMVHAADMPETIDQVLDLMRPGDVLTHCYHGLPRTGILDGDGRINRSVRRARERGVLFDVGHGAGGFAFRVAEAALAQGFLPGTISSDLHHYNVGGPVYDLVTTLSKFLLLGVPLDDVLEMATAAPARALPLPEPVGTLAVGAAGDAVVLALREGTFTFRDGAAEERTGHQKIEPVAVVRAGRTYDAAWRGPGRHSVHRLEHAP
jgi:dihydroorotase